MKLNLIAAAGENLGIGYLGNLPWRLKNDSQYFNRMTSQVNDPLKKNVCIMGRKTYFGIPESKRPLANRMNIVLTRNAVLSDYPSDVIICNSFEESLKKIQEPDIRDQIENVWIVGGYTVYKEGLESELCHRVYLTEVKATFECDAFFPEFDKTKFKLVNDPNVPSEIQEENGLQYEFKIYEKI